MTSPRASLFAWVCLIAMSSGAVAVAQTRPEAAGRADTTAQPAPGKSAPVPKVLAVDGIVDDVAGVFVETPPELVASPYVEEARRGFDGSPAGALLFAQVRVRAPLPSTYGQFANSTGRPVGGGDGYGDWPPSPPEGVVTTLAGLESALQAQLRAVQAAIGQNTPMPRKTIYIPGNVRIDIGATTLVIAPGVTLASSRGQFGSPGGLIRSSSDTLGGYSLVILTQRDLFTTRALPPVRITGLRFQGPNSTELLWDCSAAGRTAIYAVEAHSDDGTPNIVNRVVEIDNNEFGAWPQVAIEIGGIHRAYVHHNYIHHSQRNGNTLYCATLFQSQHAFGYGVAVDNGLFYIEANIFEMNRHSIASTGNKHTQYVAMYNLLGEDGPSHHFDVHGGEDRGDGTHIAGGTIVIAYNTDRADDQDAVNVRGDPVVGAFITGNQFRGDSDSVRQTKRGDDGVDITVWNNLFGSKGLDGRAPLGGGGPTDKPPTHQQ
jgi:hypothetical protein